MTGKASGGPKWPALGGLRTCSRSSAVQLLRLRAKYFSCVTCGTAFAAAPEDSRLGSSVATELFEISPQITRLLGVLDAREDHLGARNFLAWIGDVVLECRLAPGNAGVLVGLGVVVAIDRSALAAVETVQHGADLVHRIGSDGVADRAFAKRLLAGVDVLRLCRRRANDDGEHCDGEQRSGRRFNFSQAQHFGSSAALAELQYRTTC